MDIKSFLEHKILTDLDFVKKSIEDYSSQTVWHAIGDEHIIQILDNMTLEPYTKQRYWDDGLRRKDNDPDYEDSKWMYGWSMTRKKEYAMGWNSIVVELDLDKIKEQFEVKPFSWNFLFTHKADNRKEHEEFVVAHYGKKSIPQMKQEDIDRDLLLCELEDKLYTLQGDERERLKAEIDRLYDIPNWMARWDTSKGKSIDLNTCLKGIYISKTTLDIYGDKHPALKRVMEDPLYKGIFLSPKAKESLKEEKQKTKLLKP